MAVDPYDEDDHNVSPVSSIRPSNRSNLSIMSTAYVPSYNSLASDEVELTGTVKPRNEQPRQAKAFIHRLTHPFHRDSKGPAWQRAINDIKHARWRWMLQNLVAHILPVTAIIGLAVLLLIMSLPGYIEDDSTELCKPDGRFELGFKSYTPWKGGSIFAINISYGSYSFGLAKFIDVSWDVCVGRGGQALLAIFSYQVFTKALSRTMERSSVSHGTFRAVTLQNDTITGVVILLKDFFRTGGVRAKIAMSWTIVAGLFVLLLPTWLSAMTGYTADISPFVMAPNENLLPAKEFRPVVYTIHDGDRLGEPYTKDYRVAIPWYGYLMMDNSYGCPMAYLYNTSSESSNDNDRYWEVLDEHSYPNCTFMWHVSDYTHSYGFLGRTTTETEFLYPNTTSNKTYSITLQPALNISANFAIAPEYETDNSYANSYWYYYPYGMGWKDPANNGNVTFGQSDPLFMHSASNTIYNLTSFNQAGSCQQLGDVRYRWGFSFLLLYSFVAICLIWTIGMYIFYLDSYLNSRLDLVRRTMGLERAVFDLSCGMQQTIEAREAEFESNSKLEKLVKDGNLTYVNLAMSSVEKTRLDHHRQWWQNFKFSQWLKEECWWFGALVVFTVLFIASFTAPYFDQYWSYYFSFLPGFGVIQVLLAGRKIRGRWLIFVFWFLTFWGGNIWWIIRWRRYCAGYSCGYTRLKWTIS